MDDYQKYRVVMDIAQLLMMAAIGIYTWFVNRTKANATAIDEVKKEQHKIATKVNLLERDMKHLPGHDDMQKLHDKVGTVAEGMKVMEGELKNLSKQVLIISQHLMRHSND